MAKTPKNFTSEVVALPASGRRGLGEARVASPFVEELYTAHWKDLCHWLRWRYGAGPPEPEDIAQTAFLKIAALERHDHIENPRAFLFTVASNVALMGKKWLARTQRFIEAELAEVGESLEEITPESIYSSRERLSVVSRQLDLLSEKQREIVMRSRIGGQTYEQISAETGWSLADISRQLTAALVTMRRALEDYDSEDRDGQVQR